MDLSYYIEREQAERLAAEQAANPKDRESHLRLADSYRGVIEAYERLNLLQPRPTRAA